LGWRTTRPVNSTIHACRPIILCVGMRFTGDKTQISLLAGHLRNSRQSPVFKAKNNR
jgi:hypothetical protein